MIFISLTLLYQHDIYIINIVIIIIIITIIIIICIIRSECI